jgi:regulator of RNase E activity RraA
MQKLTDNNRKRLTEISTATIATCLFKRGFKNQFIQNVIPLGKGETNMVGEAFTLRYIPAREDLNPITIFKDSNHPQRVAVETCPEGAVLVIDSRNDAKAASAGSLLVTRLMIRKSSGIVTDGGFRDSAEIAALNFPSYHQRPSAPTNLTLHQALDINVPIGCGGVAVFPGDVIVGDDDGVMVIPQYLIDEIIEEGTEMTLFEEFVLKKINEGESIIGLYPPTNDSIIEDFEKWKVLHS